MNSEKKMRTALIVSVIILILGGVILTLTNFFDFLKPLGITLTTLGSIASFLSFYFWTFQL